ncbi:Fe-hydrogenase I cytochrome b subunit [Methylomonas albis]|uniref:Cytochrome b/b6 domain-containing protein n=1 Tax=Methylomonas albis TaxID=1854563 RepID=A0ABR9D6M7_9GAMM|nr:cytochrome b/b6 domain-containing protein [Methylomonas albis]MBD9358753.1 cytochrome b/b6 domain-containing protein [Methylomonas albis]CAD6882206.1 Fe-hydrogenase I cytochrome b subunit [Methylomonas albis]
MIGKKESVKVWGPLIRIGHWALVIAFFTAYLTEDDLMPIHVWAGYVVAGYLVMRIVWGFFGGKYVRFSHFVYSPARIADYLKNLITRQPQHYIGHNPAGGIMVIALLLSLTGTALTGMKLYAVEDNKGPFALSAEQLQAQTQSASLISAANAEGIKDDDDDDKSTAVDATYKVDKQSEEFWEELHEFFANLTLLLVFLHILGVIVSSYVDKEKLVKAMLTGKKDIDDTYQ